MLQLFDQNKTKNKKAMTIMLNKVNAISKTVTEIMKYKLAKSVI